MGSFKDDDTCRLLGPGKGDEPLGAADITPAMLSFHVARARRLRAEATADMLRGLARTVVRPFRRARHQATATGPAAGDCRTRVEGDLKTPLTSIRAAAEILRDHADVPVEERARFLEAIIDDSRRLERFADRLIDGIGPSTRRRAWHRRTTGRDPSVDRQAA
jgi:signal transduction histidine kinase